MPSDLNHLAIVVAALVNVVLGAVWYSQLLFARSWADSRGYREQDLPPFTARKALATFAAGLVTALVLAAAFRFAQVENIVQGLPVAAALCMGFHIFPAAVQAYRAGQTRRLFLINAGHDLAGAAAMGVILASW